MILIVSALDPTGLSGMARDIATCTDQGMANACLLTATVAENSSRVAATCYRPESDLKQELAMILEESGPSIGAIKIGLIHPDQFRAILPQLKKLKKPIVLDTVLSASSGGKFLDQPQTWQPFIKEVSLWTPNLSELSQVLGIKNPKKSDIKKVLGPHTHALVKSWKTEKSVVRDLLLSATLEQEIPTQKSAADPRGTGCTLSTLLACALASGLSMPQSVKTAHAHFQTLRGLSSGNRLLPYHAQVGLALGQLALAIPRLERLPAKPILAEVGMNLAYCLDGAKRPEDAAAFTSRLVDRSGLLHVPGHPQMAASSHVARVAVQAHQLHPPFRAAMNLRFSEALLKQLQLSGLKTASFRREDEPRAKQSQDAHTMDWGVREVFAKTKSIPDLVFDKGGPGKEPMIRLLGTSPADLLNKLEKALGLEFLSQ